MKHWENKLLEDVKGEIWKDIPIYSNLYMASNFGRIKSLGRITQKWNGNKRVRPRIMSQNRSANYLAVHLSKDKTSSPKYVHILVAMAFHPNRDNKPNVLHLDNDTKNNAADNLFWGTQKENIDQCIKEGRKNPCKGEDHRLSRFTERQVLAIRRLHRMNPNFSRAKVARKYDSKSNTITNIIKGNSWKHLL